MAFYETWLDMVRQAAAEGRRFARVRVVSRPLTDYSRFSLSVAERTVAAGDDIRYLARDHPGAEKLPNHDYWLFDSRILAMMHFGDDDRFLGAEIIDDPAVIVEHNYWRDVAWRYAVRRDDFAAE